ncbi:MAG: 16S rRNA processing protein RimM [Deltaproteobacteria bacterium]|nr:16S rRNA processing protein RimM [Deltaproteobacteria bacterium]
MGWIPVGRVVRALGLKGHLGVAGSEGGLAGLKRLALERGGERHEHRIQEARPQGRLWAVMLEGISGRTAAEGWVGAQVLALREDLPDAGPGAHYWADLQGLPVVTADGRPVGTVTGLQPTGGVDVLVVTGTGGEVLVPLAPYVTVEAGRVVVDAPEGLLELSREEDRGGAGKGR